MRPLGGSEYRPPHGPLHLLHLDADLLAVSKPVGLLSVPGKGAGLAECLLSRLEQDYPGVLLVHRLDRDTSGVMIFARGAAAQRHLGLQFERRHLTKHYVSWVRGAVTGEAGGIDLPLRADWPNRPRQMVDPDGRPARTHWEVTARTATGTRLVLWPVTGRSHQLRVHLATMGHPILGDPLYGDGAGPRMMLHAAALDLRHPDGGRHLRIAAPVPF